MATTQIEWSDVVWNPTTGCDKVSPGCDNCYALTMAKRLKAMGQAKYQADGDPRTSGPGFGLTVHPDVLEQPLRWRKPRRVFVNSMSDLFHPQVSNDFIATVFGVMAATPQHTYQVLTKRPKRMRALLSQPWKWREAVASSQGWVRRVAEHWNALDREQGGGMRWPLPNVWLGVSVEDQERADQRIPILLDTPAAVRFLSCEPLLGPIDLLNVPYRGDTDYYLDVLAGYYRERRAQRSYTGTSFGSGMASLSTVDWVIVGGESGPGARPMHPAWARSIVQQCQDAGVAVFVKQMGAWQMTGDADADVVDGSRMRRAGGHGGDPDKWPADLRVREFPRTEVTA